MAGRYDDRELWDASVNLYTGVHDSRTAHAQRGISARVTFQLKAMNADLGGPQAEIGVALPEMPGSSLAEVEEAAIAAAHDLISKFASHPVAEHMEARERQFAHDLEPFEFRMPDIGVV